MQSMLAQARTFCSIQPCSRFAEGELVVDQDGQVSKIPICPRHYEFVIKEFGTDSFDPAIVGKEVIFADETPGDIIQQIIDHGNLYKIVE